MGQDVRNNLLSFKDDLSDSSEVSGLSSSTRNSSRIKRQLSDPEGSGTSRKHRAVASKCRARMSFQIGGDEEEEGDNPAVRFLKLSAITDRQFRKGPTERKPSLAKPASSLQTSPSSSLQASSFLDGKLGKSKLSERTSNTEGCSSLNESHKYDSSCVVQTDNDESLSKRFENRSIASLPSTPSFSGNEDPLDRPNSSLSSGYDDQPPKNASFVTPILQIPSHLEPLSYLPERLRDAGVYTRPSGVPGFLSLVFGTWTDKGHRPYMEDSHIECGDLLKSTIGNSAFIPYCSSKIDDIQHLAYFGVFDGHRGWRCSSHAKSYLHQFVVNQMSLAKRYAGTSELRTNDIPTILSRAFLQLDHDFRERFPKNEAGSTAAVCLIETSLAEEDPEIGTESDQTRLFQPSYKARLHVAHIGDTRVVMGRYPEAYKRVCVMNPSDLPDDEWIGLRDEETGKSTGAIPPTIPFDNTEGERSSNSVESGSLPSQPIEEAASNSYCLDAESVANKACSSSSSLHSFNGFIPPSSCSDPLMSNSSDFFSKLPLPLTRSLSEGGHLWLNPDCTPTPQFLQYVFAHYPEQYQQYLYNYGSGTALASSAPGINPWRRFEQRQEHSEQPGATETKEALSIHFSKQQESLPEPLEVTKPPGAVIKPPEPPPQPLQSSVPQTETSVPYVTTTTSETAKVERNLATVSNKSITMEKEHTDQLDGDARNQNTSSSHRLDEVEKTDENLQGVQQGLQRKLTDQEDSRDCDRTSDVHVKSQQKREDDNLAFPPSYCNLYLSPFNLSLLEAHQLTSDHKPIRWDEKKRIESAGGFVALEGCWRVRISAVPHMLAVSRAFGNWSMKLAQKGVLVAEPEVTSIDLEPFQDLFIIIATDGVWDVCSNDEAVRVVGEVLNKEERIAVEREELGSSCTRLKESSHIDSSQQQCSQHNEKLRSSKLPNITSSGAFDPPSISSTADSSSTGSVRPRGRYLFQRSWTSPQVLRLAGKALIDHCLRKKTEDNMTVTIVRFCWDRSTLKEKQIHYRTSDE